MTDLPQVIKIKPLECKIFKFPYLTTVSCIQNYEIRVHLIVDNCVLHSIDILRWDSKLYTYYNIPTYKLY